MNNKTATVEDYLKESTQRTTNYKLRAIERANEFIISRKGQYFSIWQDKYNWRVCESIEDFFSLEQAQNYIHGRPIHKERMPG